VETEAEVEVCIGGGGGRGGTSEVEVGVAKTIEAEAVETEAVEAKAAKAAEAEGCVRGGGMHQKCTEVDGANGANSEDKVSEGVKMVRTCQNSLGQNGTRLGLLLLLVGPNGDGFGGQAFMEHYSGELSLHNLTDMRRKALAGFGLHMDRVPVVYHRLHRLQVLT
jgi:hypothetical protein